MNSVFNVMVYTTRNKNFKGTCFFAFVCNYFTCNNCKYNILKHEWDEMIALLTCRRRALKLKQRRSKYRIQLSSSSSPDTSEAWQNIFAIFYVTIIILNNLYIIKYRNKWWLKCVENEIIFFDCFQSAEWRSGSVLGP